jgi:hypothetical protein
MRAILLVSLLAATAPAFAQVSRTTAGGCHLEGPEVIAAFSNYITATP